MPHKQNRDSHVCTNNPVNTTNKCRANYNMYRFLEKQFNWWMLENRNIHMPTSGKQLTINSSRPIYATWQRNAKITTGRSDSHFIDIE